MDRKRIIRELRKCRLRPDGDTRQYTICDTLGQGGNGVTFIVHVGKQELVAKVYMPPDSRDLDSAAFKRFKREIELSSRTRHPFVVPVFGTGNIQLGAYTFPFYLMPRAKGTLRQLIPKAFDYTDLGQRLRIFTQVVSGVSYLHHLDIYHRDLKPENILLSKRDIPMVADLGIAHVARGFVEWSKLTLPKDHLMNWDYYAPEQRGGDATKVDHRADIYALGLILYELITGISPSRPNLPPLIDCDSRLKPLDELFQKMTAHDPSARFDNLDLLQDDLTWTLIPMGIPSSAPSSEDADKKVLIRLMRSANAGHQARAHDIVLRLGEKALPELHELIADRRIDVALASYKLIGTLAHKNSLPYLLGGLYPRRTALKPRFITGEAAAQALRSYPIDDRLATLNDVKDLVLPSHVALIIDGIPTEQVYPVVLRLYKSKLMYDDWGQQSAIAFLLRLNQDEAWKLVQVQLAESKTVYSFTIFDDFYPNVNSERQMALIDYTLKQDSDLSSWGLPRVYTAISTGHFPAQFMITALSRLKSIAHIKIKKWEERESFIAKLTALEAKVKIALPTAKRKGIGVRSSMGIEYDT